MRLLRLFLSVKLVDGGCLAIGVGDTHPGLLAVFQLDAHTVTLVPHLTRKLRVVVHHEVVHIGHLDIVGLKIGLLFLARCCKQQGTAKNNNRYFPHR